MFLFLFHVLDIYWSRCRSSDENITRVLLSHIKSIQSKSHNITQNRNLDPGLADHLSWNAQHGHPASIGVGVASRTNRPSRNKKKRNFDQGIKFLEALCTVDCRRNGESMWFPHEAIVEEEHARTGGLGSGRAKVGARDQHCHVVLPTTGLFVY